MNRAFRLFQAFKSSSINFYAGVPDSVLQGFLRHLNSEPNHFVTANEGAALALVTGHYLATGKPGLVYLQNSGLGNLINPLTSLTHPSAYSCPAILLIGWRGRPGTTDEPQHYKMGSITLSMLDLLDIPYRVLSEADEVEPLVDELYNQSLTLSAPVALIVDDRYFEKARDPQIVSGELSAADVFHQLLAVTNSDDIFFCTTGKIGRLFDAICNTRLHHTPRYFMNVGAMGHLSSLATGFSLASEHRVFVLDGDGSVLMHLGGVVTRGLINSGNLRYIVLNNGVHQSVGSQPTAGFQTDFMELSRFAGFSKQSVVNNQDELKLRLDDLDQGKEFIEIRINTQMPDSLPRPAQSLINMKSQFMKPGGL